MGVNTVDVPVSVLGPEISGQQEQLCSNVLSKYLSARLLFLESSLTVLSLQCRLYHSPALLPITIYLPLLTENSLHQTFPGMASQAVLQLRGKISFPSKQ